MTGQAQEVAHLHRSVLAIAAAVAAAQQRRRRPALAAAARTVSEDVGGSSSCLSAADAARPSQPRGRRPLQLRLGVCGSWWGASC